MRISILQQILRLIKIIHGILRIAQIDQPLLCLFSISVVVLTEGHASDCVAWYATRLAFTYDCGR